MFRKITLEERAASDAKAMETLRTGSYGVLSTIGRDGFPYGVPLNYSLFNDCICFHCATKGHKLDNINFSEKVSFCVVTKSNVLENKFDTDYESVIAFGKAVEVSEDSEKEHILLSLLNKYSADFMEAGKNYIKKYWDDTKVIKIKIDHLAGKTGN